MNALRQKIEHEIQERGPIPFSRYMELCLYDPELGYYSRNAAQFGKAGDFYTSSDVHAVFGRLLARQFEEMWRVLGSPERIVIEELGPGRGLFAQDVLDWSERKFPDFFHALRYELDERSPALRQRIEATLSRHLGSGRAVLGIREVNRHVSRIVFANEFFDALPVEIVSSRGFTSHRHERWPVRGDVGSTFARGTGISRPLLDSSRGGERVEVPLEAQNQYEQARRSSTADSWSQSTTAYTREEQLAGRHRGTLKAIRQHSVSANPYEAPGEQDITADVNFTALAAAAEKQGMQTQKLVTQSQFLLGIGETNEFADAFEECRLPQERAKVALQLKHLVTPAGMGESFHVLVASGGIEEVRARSLAGLSFGKPKDRA